MPKLLETNLKLCNFWCFPWIRGMKLLNVSEVQQRGVLISYPFIARRHKTNMSLLSLVNPA